MGEHERNGLPVITGLLHCFVQKALEIAHPISFSGMFPVAFDNAPVYRHSLELVVQPTYAQGRQVRRDGVAARLATDGESNHASANVLAPASTVFRKRVAILLRS